jgi:very-short-patch-repair endonuclease
LDLRKAARHLRKNMTPEEVKLWVNLKVLNKQGYNFRRQAPVDGYILDFAEFTQRLIIEIDGVIHKILSVLKEPPPALRATSPARGEDK